MVSNDRGPWTSDFNSLDNLVDVFGNPTFNYGAGYGSLGVETVGDVMTRLIERDATLPTRRSRAFTTVADNQRTVEIRILQGEQPAAQNNQVLARFRLVGIPPMPKGAPRILVGFDLRSPKGLNVSAKLDVPQGQLLVTLVRVSETLGDESQEGAVDEVVAMATRAEGS